MSDSISEDNIQLDWKKPLGLLSAGNVKSYILYMSSTNSGPNPTSIVPVTITKTTFLITNSTPLPPDVTTPFAHGHSFYFWIAGSNAAGIGAITSPLSINF